MTDSQMQQYKMRLELLRVKASFDTFITHHSEQIRTTPAASTAQTQANQGTPQKS